MLYAYPRVLPLGQTLTIRLRSEKPVFAAGEFVALFTACEVFKNEQSATQGEVISGFEVFHTTNKPVERLAEVESPFVCRVTLCCPAEQEYILRVYQQTGTGRQPVDTACIYAIEPDLCSLLPFKGDLHLHSWHSDGENSPLCMAAACREKGFDFMALTDHGKFGPSQELRRTLQGISNLGFEAYTGEEIHLPWHQTHILNIGGSASVNQVFLQSSEDFLTQVAALKGSVNLPEAVDEYQYLSALWAFDKVREYGGLSVFCHPYWRRPSGFELCAQLTEALLQSSRFDALELISGYGKHDTDSNLLQVARYFDLERRPPIVGVSDAHAAYSSQVPAGEYLLGAFYTLVLDRSNKFEDIRAGILDRLSVAVEHQEQEQRHIYGPYRLVKYFQFLAREFFPEHDALAAREAAAIRGLEAGEPALGLAAAMEQLYRQAFAT